MSDNDDPMNIPEYLAAPSTDEIMHAVGMLTLLADCISDGEVSLNVEPAKDGPEEGPLALVRVTRVLFQLACIAARTCPGCRALEVASDYHGMDPAKYSYEDPTGEAARVASARIFGEGERNELVTITIDVVRSTIDTIISEQEPESEYRTRRISPKVPVPEGTVTVREIPRGLFDSTHGDEDATSVLDDPGVRERVIEELARSLPDGIDMDSAIVTLSDDGIKRQLTVEERDKIIALRHVMKQTKGEEVH